MSLVLKLCMKPSKAVKACFSLICMFRYEDNGDAVNNLVVITKQTGNKSIEDFGSPDKWLQDNAKLLGEDVWKGNIQTLPRQCCTCSRLHSLLDFVPPAEHVTIPPTIQHAFGYYVLIKHLVQAGINLCDAGLSRSEGGFKENKVSSASVLDVQAANDKKGKPYYKYEILTRTGTAKTCVASTVARETWLPRVHERFAQLMTLTA